MTTKTETETRKPDFIVKYELARKGEKKRLVTIGVGFRNNGGAFTLFMNAKPLDGYGDKLIAFPLEADEAALIETV